jgi:uncharacterized protein
MRLYSGMSREFIDHAVHNRIAALLRDAFQRVYRYRPSPGEENSWRNSLRAVSQVFQHGELLDHGIILEYQLPLTSLRLDCLVSGRNQKGGDEAVIIELKQWSGCEAASEPDLVRTVIGQAKRDVLHPSAQVGQYCHYLSDVHTAFHEGEQPIALSGCAYLHNYEAEKGDALFSSRYGHLLSKSPVFSADDVDPLTKFLRSRLARGEGKPVLDRIERSRYQPSRKLLEHLAKVVEGEPAFTLLDEQKVVFDKIYFAAKEGIAHRKKHVFLIHGGPGTGKSVVAIQLMAQLSKRELRNAQYATGSQAFTETLRKIVGRRAAQQFKYFNNYGKASSGEVDVLICDEAHRLRKTSANRFTPKARQTGKAQIQELIDAAKVVVFFIDDRQVVRPNEVGSGDLIRKAAVDNKCELQEYTLETQFRCAGSEGFINWIDNTLGIQKTANVIWNQEEEKNFEFRIFGSPVELEEAIRRKSTSGYSARMTAGYCWPWSKTLGSDGVLLEDVVIGDYRRPWNARSTATGLAPGIPKEVLWAYDARGIDQVGCVYTAQGFEFDYVGVIWGPDLTYDSAGECWIGNKSASHDAVVRRSGERFIDLVKNTYRVLLSRGLKGCYVHFMDKGTETFVRNRCEGLGTVVTTTAPVVGMRRGRKIQETLVDLTQLPPNVRVLPSREVRPYANAVPLLDLKIAAGHFRGDEVVDSDEMRWVQLPDSFRMREGIFVAQVVGESMNRRIPNGAWCVFSKPGIGSREGKVVIASHRKISDTDTGLNVTVKTYHSEKVYAISGEWHHDRIVLKPYSTDKSYQPIVLEPNEAENLEVIAELIAVL